MHNKRLTTSGFSLLELLLYIGLSGTIVIIYSTLLFSAQSSRQKSEAIAEVNEQAHFALASIERDVMSADSLSYPLPGSASSSLSLMSPDIARNPITFRLESGRIYSDENTDSYPLTSPRIVIDDLEFIASAIGSSTIMQVAISAHNNNPNGRQENEYSQTSTSTLIFSR